MAKIDFFVELIVPSETDFLGIDDHHEIAAINMGRINSFVFPGELPDNRSRHATENLPFRINNMPGSFQIVFVGMISCHCRNLGSRDYINMMPCFVNCYFVRLRPERGPSISLCLLFCEGLEQIAH